MGRAALVRTGGIRVTAYAELCVTSNFTFLRGASHPEELVTRAAELGLAAIAITDRNSVAGVVRAFSALKELERLREEAQASGTAPEGPAVRSRQVTDHSSRQALRLREDGPLIPADRPLPKLIPGARLNLSDSDVEWLALPMDVTAWSRLTRLLSLGKRRAEKGACHLTRADLLEWGRGMVLIALPPDPLDGSKEGAGDLRTMARAFPGRCFLGAAPRYDGRDPARLAHLARLADSTGLPMMAVGDVLMHRAARRPLTDVLTCLRVGCTIDNIGTQRLTNGERRLKAPADMARMFHRHPAAIRRTLEIADACAFRLDDLRYQYPDEAQDDEPAQTRLERLSREGLHWRYPKGPPARIVTRVDKELRLIDEMGYAPYFLTVHDIVAFARSKGILCQGRGSAANSVVCYLLGVTEVPPESITLIFERFISKERGEPPDIDVDFEHERREEVIQWIYARYGRERAGLTATVIHFRSRAAIREVGKVMGLSQDVIARLSGQIWGWSSSAPDEDRMRDAGIDPADSRVALAAKLIGEIIGFPRHLSQHVGGFVISRGPITRLVPVENAAMAERTLIQWDKDDLEALGLMKIDVLALGMLTAIRKCLATLAELGEPIDRIDAIPLGDPATYDMLCRGDSVGVFQVESRAQMAMLPRLRPRCYYDLVIQVAIVRPGPIQGDMVHPFLRRRAGSEPVTYPSDAIRAVLERTLGVPIFQEQVIKLAMVAAGFSGGEADRLRRAMASWGKSGHLLAFEHKLIEGMTTRGYDPDFARRLFEQIKGFGGYGFPESHAASFALLVYVSAWLKCHYPAAFYCALLNSQPMGFYSPSQLVQDARRHGVEVRPVDVAHSHWDHALEATADERQALRLGLRLVRGLHRAAGERIAAARQRRPFAGLPELARRARLDRGQLAVLAAANALQSFSGHRHQAQWDVAGLERPLPLTAAAPTREPGIRLPAPATGADLLADYRAIGLTLGPHPMALLRAHPLFHRCARQRELPNRRNGSFVRIAGLVTGRQRPGTASGVIFLTLEDETGNINVVVWRNLQTRFRSALLNARLLLVKGVLEQRHGVCHVIAGELIDHSVLLADLAIRSRDFH